MTVLETKRCVCSRKHVARWYLFSLFHGGCRSTDDRVFEHHKIIIMITRGVNDQIFPLECFNKINVRVWEMCQISTDLPFTKKINNKSSEYILSY